MFDNNRDISVHGDVTIGGESPYGKPLVTLSSEQLRCEFAFRVEREQIERRPRVRVLVVVMVVVLVALSVSAVLGYLFKDANLITAAGALVAVAAAAFGLKRFGSPGGYELDHRQAQKEIRKILRLRGESPPAR